MLLSRRLLSVNRKLFMIPFETEVFSVSKRQTKVLTTTLCRLQRGCIICWKDFETIRLFFCIPFVNHSFMAITKKFSLMLYKLLCLRILSISQKENAFITPPDVLSFPLHLSFVIVRICNLTERINFRRKLPLEFGRNIQKPWSDLIKVGAAAILLHYSDSLFEMNFTVFGSGFCTVCSVEFQLCKFRSSIALNRQRKNRR